jgi:regulator of replication initiation timing
MIDIKGKKEIYDENIDLKIKIIQMANEIAKLKKIIKSYL